MSLIDLPAPLVEPRHAGAPVFPLFERLSRSRRLRIWAVAAAAFTIALIVQAAFPQLGLLARLGIQYSPAAVLAIVFTAMAAEYVNASLGMGYGTLLTPLLLLCNFRVAEIVPAILLSECLNGLIAGALHHRDGNVDFMRDLQARRVLSWIVSLSAAGSILAVAVALRAPELWLRIGVGSLILGVGATMLFTASHRLTYKPVHLVLVGAVAAFNKALSCGGYGPLVTGGQVVSGVSARQAIACTSAAKGITCLIGLVAYIALGRGMNWSLAIPLICGSLLTAPLGTLTVRCLSEKSLRYIAGIVACLLGAATLAKIAV